jgi:hypothetical protein
MIRVLPVLAAFCVTDTLAAKIQRGLPGGA